MSKKPTRSTKDLADEMNPVTFVRRLRQMPLLDRVFNIIDRFLM